MEDRLKKVLATGTKAYTLFQFISQRTIGGFYTTTLSHLANLVFDSKSELVNDLNILMRYKVIQGYLNPNDSDVKVEVLV